MRARVVSTFTLLALIAGCNMSGPTDVAMPATRRW